MEILPEDVNPILTAKEASEYLRINSEKKLYNLFNSEKFPSFKSGGRWRVGARDLDKYLVNKRDNNQEKSKSQSYEPNI